MTAALVLACLLQTPDEINDLVGKLASESIEERDGAMLRLLDIGRPARRALKEASERSNPEVRVRALSLLHEIDLMLVFGRGWRVTFEPSEYRIAEIVDGIRKQTKVRIQVPRQFLQDKVRVDAERELLWSLMDRVCEAHGGIRVSRDMRGETLRVVIGKPAKAPVDYWGPFRTVIENLAVERRLIQGGDASRGVIQVATSWQPNVHPVGGNLRGVSIHLDEVRMANGRVLQTRLTPGFPEPGYGSDGNSPRSRAGFFFFEAPPSGTNRLAGIRGHTLVHLPLGYETVTLGPREAGGLPDATVGGCKAELKEWDVKPGEAKVVIELSIRPAGFNPEALPLSGRVRESSGFEFLLAGDKTARATSVRQASRRSGGRDRYEIVLSAETNAPARSLRFDLLSDHFERRIDFEFADVELP